MKWSVCRVAEQTLLNYLYFGNEGLPHPQSDGHSDSRSSTTWEKTCKANGEGSTISPEWVTPREMVGYAVGANNHEHSVRVECIPSQEVSCVVYPSSAVDQRNYAPRLRGRYEDSHNGWAEVAFIVSGTLGTQKFAEHQ